MSGKYTVTGTAPAGRVALSPERVTVVDRGCAEVNFYTSWDGRIRGHVRDYESRPVAGIVVSIAYASQQGKPFISQTNPVITDKSGAYEVQAVQPGTYLVMVDYREPYPEAPNAIVFYPDATVSNNAKTVTIGQATTREGIDITLPKPLKPGN